MSHEQDLAVIFSASFAESRSGGLRCASHPAPAHVGTADSRTSHVSTIY
jgi:hypothetical protein